MKIAEKTVEVQSNITFDESVAVTIDESAVSMVIERLISAYKNPYRAVLREYTSNAYDEHVASGQTAPVEVSLPSSLSPVLKVQDYGRGLTREELKGFGTIGMSTKRDSDEFTGGFGMGSKSALAASSQFTVVSVKNGKRNTVVVARDEHNVPHMNFLPEADTDDTSGTTVIVPISDPEKFGDLTDFWVGWKPGSLLVDGEQPARSVYNPNNFHAVGGGTAFSDKQNISSGRDGIRILINQVYYNLNYQTLGLSYNQWNLLKYYIIKIDNGTVDIAPSREDLLYNARTKAALDKRFSEVLTISSKDMVEQVRNADSLHDALLIREKMASLGFPTDGLKWGKTSLVLPGDTIKGNKVPASMGTWTSPQRDNNTKSGYRVEKTWGEISRMAASRLAQVRGRRFVIVHSAGEPGMYGTYNNRMAHREAFGVAEYLQAIDGSGNGWDFFFTSEPLNRINRIYRDLADSILTAEEFNKTVSDFRAVIRAQERADAIAKKAHRKLRLLTSIDSYGSSVSEVEAGDLVDEYAYVVVLRNQIGGLEQYIRDAITTKANYKRQVAVSIRHLKRQHNVAIILTGKNDDLSGYKDVLPPITTFDALAAKDLLDSVKPKSKLERVAKRDREKYTVSSITSLKDEYLKGIKNKETRHWVKAVRDYRDDSSAIQDMHSWFRGWSPDVKGALDGVRAGSTKELPESPIKKYPLLEHVYTYNVPLQAVVDYINLVDQA